MSGTGGTAVIAEEQGRVNPQVTEQWEREKREQQRKTGKEESEDSRGAERSPSRRKGHRRDE